MTLRALVGLPPNIRASSVALFLALGGVITIAAIWPVVIAVIAFVGQALLCGLNIIAASVGRNASRTVHGTNERYAQPVLSVHVPTHNEPPDVVIATLESLASQISAPPHEVIVIDNNTSDPALWRPVEAWCRRMPGFWFMHREGVTGAKAGALNIALAHSRPDATHVVIIDADYRVAPDFMACAARELSERDADFLQFPQAYVECGWAGIGIATELVDYFDRHANAANRADAMLLTGTLSVISRPALEAVGGWSSRTSTEDAELGLRLGEAGYRGAYIDRVMGRGMLPLSLDALHRQRYRWASGNMRTLVCWVADQLCATDAKPVRTGAVRNLLIAAQLTAWNSFALPAALALSISAVHLALFPSVGSQIAGELAALTLVLVLLAAVLPLFAMRRRSKGGLSVAVSSRLSMLPTSALATLSGMLPGKQTFIVTPKFTSNEDRRDAHCVTNVVSAIWGIGLLLAGMLLSSPFIAVGAWLLVLPWLASDCATRALSAYTSALHDQEV